MKRKLLFAIAAGILLSVSVYGTLAHFTTEQHTQNIIIAGDIRIKLCEWSDRDKTTPFPAEGVSLVVPGTAVTKIVEGKNIGRNAAYVRVLAEKKISLKDGSLIDPDPDLLLLDIDQTFWQEQPDGYYYYVKELEPGETTEPFFHTVTFDASMGNDYQDSTATIEITMQAVQSQNNGTDPLTAGGWPER